MSPRLLQCPHLEAHKLLICLEQFRRCLLKDKSKAIKCWISLLFLMTFHLFYWLSSETHLKLIFFSFLWSIWPSSIQRSQKGLKIRIKICLNIYCSSCLRVTTPYKQKTVNLSRDEPKKLNFLTKLKIYIIKRIKQHVRAWNRIVRFLLFIVESRLTRFRWWPFVSHSFLVFRISSFFSMEFVPLLSSVHICVRGNLLEFSGERLGEGWVEGIGVVR